MNRILTCAFLLLPLCASAQEPINPVDKKSAPDSKAPSAAPKLVNPVKPTPNSLAIGKKAYTSDCAMCHGKDGAGAGEADFSHGIGTAFRHQREDEHRERWNQPRQAQEQRIECQRRGHQNRTPPRYQRMKRPITMNPR